MVTGTSGFPSLPRYAAFPSEPVLFRSLVFHAQKIRCDEDRTLFKQGDWPIGIYLVRSGAVQAIVHGEDGSVAAILHANPGAVLGLPAAVSNKPYSLSALARQGSDIAFISKDDFEILVQSMPELSFAILKVLAAEVQAARAALVNS